jgi:hypothetical protein
MWGLHLDKSHIVVKNYLGSRDLLPGDLCRGLREGTIGAVAWHAYRVNWLPFDPPSLLHTYRR